MAGIGFELKKILKGDSFLSDITAYLYAALISSGPWLMAVVCLGILGVLEGTTFGRKDMEVFRSTIVYTYAFSLIFVGVIQLVVTRYLADRFFEKKEKNTLATFSTCMALVLGFGAILSGVSYYFFEISLLHKLSGVVLFLIISMIWICMIFLSATKDYKSIVYAFAVGSIGSIFAAPFMSKYYDIDGYLIGYILGQALTFFWLFARLLVEFPNTGVWDSGLLFYFKKYWDLAVIGFVFNLAIWVDKFVFWFSQDARLLVPWFRTNTMYEGAVFFSYLTIIPTLALFLVKIETNFYLHYKNYYGKIMSKKSFADILQEKEGMIIMLKETIREVFIIQGSVTLLCIIFAPQLISMARLSELQIPMFRVCLVGSFLQVLLTINIIILFYFDLRKYVLTVTTIFLFTNTGLSLLTSKLGIQFYGYGYTYACLISLILAFYFLIIAIRDLEYKTFAGQPIS